MYAKLFSRITESSLLEESVTTRWVFVALLAIAEIDGTVIGTDIAIARRINVPLKDFEDSMQILMAPDTHSNNQDFGGARVIHSGGERGYFLTGYARYRSLKTEDERRHYMKEYMAKRRSSVNNVNNDVNSVNFPLAQLTHAEEEAETKENTDSMVIPTPKKSQEGFESFWMVYPKKRGKGKARVAFEKALKMASLDEILLAVGRLVASPDWIKEDGKFVPHPATWLNSEGWHDQPGTFSSPKINSEGVEVSKFKSW